MALRDLSWIHPGPLAVRRAAIELVLLWMRRLFVDIA